MAKANLGTKRVCPETGRKFYDLEKDPIVSPYTGNEYPLSFFETEVVDSPKPDDGEKPSKDEATTEASEEEELDTAAADDGPEIISLEDAEDDTDTADGDDEEIPDIPDIPEVDIDDDEDSADDDTFLEDDEEDDDLSDVIVSREDKEEDL